MQNPRQPLGPFPREIVQTIAQQDPRTYSGLAQASQRLRNVVQPVLSQVCQSPIRGYEIVRAIVMLYKLRNPEYKITTFLPFTLTRDNEISIQGDNSYSLPLNPERLLAPFKGGISYSSPLNGAGRDMDRLLSSGYKPTLDIVLQVYKNRLSCVRANPNFANELLIQEYLNRRKLLQKYNNELDFFTYRLQLINLVKDFSEALNQSIPDFYYEVPHSNIEYLDYFERLDAEAQRLIQLARDQ